MEIFSFTLFSPYAQLIHSQEITIDNNNVLFAPLKKLLENNSQIEILEEGTDEGKSIILQTDNKDINIIFKLTETPTKVASISLTNIRLASPNVTFGNGSPQISDFKNKLHLSLLEIKNSLKEYSM